MDDLYVIHPDLSLKPNVYAALVEACEREGVSWGDFIAALVETAVLSSSAKSKKR